MNTIHRSPILACGWLFGLAASLVLVAVHAAAAHQIPLPGPETPAARPIGPAAPEWVGRATEREGESLLVTVSAGPYSSPEECRQALPEAMRGEAIKFIDDLLGEPGAAKRIDLSDGELQQLRVIDPKEGTPLEHLESMSLSVGTMFTLHTQLRFDRRFSDVIQARWREAIAGDRLRIAGYAVLGSLALIGLVHTIARWLAS